MNLDTLSSISSQLSHKVLFGFVLSLVGIVFATMVSVTVYQFHNLYFAKSGVYFKLRATVALHFKHHDTTPENVISPVNSSHDPHNIVSKTVINLREPWLEEEGDNYTS